MASAEAVQALTPTLGADAARALADRFLVADVPAGRVLYADGEPADQLVVVLSGTLAVSIETVSGSVEIARRGPGSWFGEVGLIDRGPATATVHSDGPSRILCIDHDGLMRAQEEDPVHTAALLRHLSRQLAERIATGSAGLIEELAPGRYQLKKAEEQRGWIRRMLGRLLGEDA